MIQGPRQLVKARTGLTKEEEAKVLEQAEAEVQQ